MICIGRGEGMSYFSPNWDTHCFPWIDYVLFSACNKIFSLKKQRGYPAEWISRVPHHPNHKGVPDSENNNRKNLSHKRSMEVLIGRCLRPLNVLWPLGTSPECPIWCSCVQMRWSYVRSVERSRNFPGCFLNSPWT